MDRTLITAADIASRVHWTAQIGRARGGFAADAGQLEQELADEIGRQGDGALIGHLRLCGAIPEAYRLRQQCGETLCQVHRLGDQGAGASAGKSLLHDVFSSIETILPTKNANNYWQAMNRALLNRQGASELWREEKIALLESIEIAKREALNFLMEERKRIMNLSRQEAIQEVLAGRKLEARVQAVESVTENRLLDIGEVE